MKQTFLKSIYSREVNDGRIDNNNNKAKQNIQDSWRYGGQQNWLL